MEAMRRLAAITSLSLMLALSACSGDNPGSASVATRAATATPTTAATGSPTTPAPRGTAGCGTPADAPPITAKRPGDVERTLTVGDRERIYRLGVPTDYDDERPSPLVMNLHGAGSNALQASVYGGVPQEADERGMIEIAPEAFAGKWQLGGSGYDHDFLVALLDDIENRYCIDTDRVFLIGMSLGAWKAAATACAMGDRVAAIALVTVEVRPGVCGPIPVVAFHGTADPIVPYGEGSGREFPGSPNAGLPGTRDNIAHWAQGNGCDKTPDKTEIGTDVEVWTYRDCTADVVLYTILGGGHTWPGETIKTGATTRTIDATQIAFDWFDAHPRTRPR